jgi:diguanylate cyclase (GGDEF)-like protein
MQLNVLTDIASVLVAVIIISYARSDNLERTLSSTYLSWYMYAVLLYPFFHIGSTAARLSCGSWQPVLVQGFAILSYATASLFVMLLVQYVAALLIENHPRRAYYLWVVRGSYILVMLLLLTNPFTDLFFTCSDTGVFNLGPLYLSGHVLSLFHIALLIYLIIRYRRTFGRSLAAVLFMLPSIALASTVILIISPQLPITGPASAAQLLILVLYFQNKATMLDKLTGLPNDVSYISGLDRLSHQKKRCSLVFIDLQDFKLFNKLYGYHTGNNLLRQVSVFLKATVPQYALYRYNGDVFALLLRDNQDSQLENLLDTIRNRFSSPWYIDRLRFSVSVTISGIRGFLVTDAEEAVNIQEFCLEETKKHRNRELVCSYENVLRDYRRSQVLFDMLRNPLDQTALEVHYQPIYDVKRRRFVSAEALLRIRDDELGLISGFDFITAAENLGQSIELGYELLGMVCRDIRDHVTQHSGWEAVSINFSALQLADSQFFDRFIATLDRYDVDPSRLRIEITENALVGNFEDINTLITSLRLKGIRFYLDDFGTDYTNLARVMQLNFEYIKIDRSIFQYSAEETESLELLRKILVMFKDYGMETVLEGVEREAHQAAAEHLGPDYIQGFLYARPVPIAEASARFDEFTADTPAH